ncbi:hypothetical protein [Roseovarius litorisediminis]|uniref:hypothetical protein n=1 Tax=Roseovarius litorisediminis TaxID=1312363 RepID=UPI000A272422|nr:hypothetical protein [Roseovarius litorisediminis]
MILWAGARQSKYPQLLLQADETGIKLGEGEKTHWSNVESLIVLNSYLAYSPRQILTVRRRYTPSGSAAKRVETVARHVLEDRSTPISLGDRPAAEILDRLGTLMAGAGYRLDGSPTRKYRGLCTQSLWPVISDDHKDVI